jgi:serine/threonine-protein kinase
LATKEEMELGAKLVIHEILSREVAEASLKFLDKLRKGGKSVTLSQILLKKGLVTQQEIDSLMGVPLTERQPLADYRFLKKIAVGGMAEVYLATYLPIQEDVALKIMKPELYHHEGFRLRFKREAKLLEALDHENIVKGFELRSAEGYLFCAMEHVDGATVEERIERDGPFDERLALYVTREIARALSYLDRRGVVHRDLKPGNVLLTEDGQVKLIDLGLAKLRDGMMQDSQAGLTVGTVEYLSPEQARGREDVDIRSDIYSLGVSLFHMMVGEVPFKGESNADVIAMQVLKTLESPVLKSRSVSALTHYLIQKMMVKERRDRFQHPDEIIEEIKEKAGDVSDAVGRPVVLKPAWVPPESKGPVLKPDAGSRKKRSARRRKTDRRTDRKSGGSRFGRRKGPRGKGDDRRGRRR